MQEAAKGGLLTVCHDPTGGAKQFEEDWMTEEFQRLLCCAGIFCAMLLLSQSCPLRLRTAGERTTVPANEELECGEAANERLLLGRLAISC